MPGLADAITVSCSVKSVRFDDDEAVLTLRIPASEVAKAARFALMRQIQFEGVFTPVDAKQKEDDRL